MIIGGVILPGSDASITLQKAFFGICPSPEGIPIDVIPICLLTNYIKDYMVLVTDNFLGFNGAGKQIVQETSLRLFSAIDKIDHIYKSDLSFKGGYFKQRNFTIAMSSLFMDNDGYLDEYVAVKCALSEKPELDQMLRETIPQKIRHEPLASTYPIHELALVRHLAKRLGYECKIGPSKEKEYDGVMQSLGFPMKFAYILDAYALGTKEPYPVVHYQPLSRGTNGQRIMLGGHGLVTKSAHENERAIRQKIQQSCDEAVRYLCAIGSVAGIFLKQQALHPDEIRELQGRKLKGEGMRLIIENIVRPYNEAQS